MQKQVDKNHYDFQSYMGKRRWSSLWMQLKLVSGLAPGSVLELGPGAGVFKANAQLIGLNIETVDIDPELQPDHLGSATSLPFADNSYDLSCAFQMLEHLPYEDSLAAFAELVRVSRKNIVISLPNTRPVWRGFFHLQGWRARNLMLRKPFWRPPEHRFDGQHYWELDKQGYELERVSKDLQQHARLLRQFRLFEHPYHHFFVFKKP